MNIRKDFKFLYWAVVWSLLILMSMHVFKPALAPDPRAAEIQDYAAKLQLFSADEAMTELNKKTGKPTMLMVYASWCPYCHQIMPELIKLKRDGELKNLRLFFLSRDRELSRLGDYLVRSGYRDDITPYVLSSGQLDAFAEKLHEHKATAFSGGVPYIAFFDTKGHLMAEMVGAAPKGEIEKAVRAVTASGR